MIEDISKIQQVRITADSVVGHISLREFLEKLKDIRVYGYALQGGVLLVEPGERPANYKDERLNDQHTKYNTHYEDKIYREEIKEIFKQYVDEPKQIVWK